MPANGSAATRDAQAGASRRLARPPDPLPQCRDLLLVRRGVHQAFRLHIRRRHRPRSYARPATFACAPQVPAASPANRIAGGNGGGPSYR
jgi:hypothetical protein